jgi:dienelactone hydrolase
VISSVLVRPRGIKQRSPGVLLLHEEREVGGVNFSLRVTARTLVRGGYVVFVPDLYGVIGYSMGGGYALQLACVNPATHVAAVFSGQLPRPILALTNAGSVVGSYADRDPTTRGLADRLERELRVCEIVHDVKVYAGAGHAFYDPLGPAYDAAHARDAWSRTIDFTHAILE